MEHYKNLSLDDIKSEIWKDIEGFNGLYQVSNLARVKSLKCGKTKILKQNNSNGYLIVSFNKNGEREYPRVHRLVAKAFILNPENKSQVNHKNGIKTDNKLENLEWCTAQENMRHAFDTGLKVGKKGENSPIFGDKHPLFGKKGKDNKSSKPIYQYTKSCEFIKKWNCMSDAANELKIHNSSISQCAKGKRPSAGKYLWKYEKLEQEGKGII